MAMFIFTKSIIEGTPIKLFNHGKMRRDFTHIDDVTPYSIASDRSRPRCRDKHGARRLGSTISAINNPEELMHVVALLEKELGRTAVKEMLPMQPGDVPETFADVERSRCATSGLSPQTSIEDGIAQFVDMVSRVSQGLSSRWTNASFH